MARKARVEFEGAVYHVLDRGDRREAIFKDDEARRLLEEGLRCRGVEREELAGLKKSAPRKAALAVRLRPRTTAPNAWIAEQLQLGQVSRGTHWARTAPAELLRKLDSASHE